MARWVHDCQSRPSVVESCWRCEGCCNAGALHGRVGGGGEYESKGGVVGIVGIVGFRWERGSPASTREVEAMEWVGASKEGHINEGGGGRGTGQAYEVERNCRTPIAA